MTRAEFEAELLKIVARVPPSRYEEFLEEFDAAIAYGNAKANGGDAVPLGEALTEIGGRGTSAHRGGATSE